VKLAGGVAAPSRDGLQTITHQYACLVRHTELADQECAIARTWVVIGERWTMMILRECFRGVGRFEDIQAKLQLGRNILAERLQTLVEEGILERRQYRHTPVRHEYVLTPKGEDLYPVLLAVLRWGNKHKVDTPPLQLMHKSCGHIVQPVTVCTECRNEIHHTDLRAYFADNAW
jgi:DNA-binding HxlR family transcriptional regulator